MDSMIFSNRLVERSLRGALVDGVRRLSADGLDSARLDAELLLAYALGMSREQLVSAQDMPLESRQLADYEFLLQRRLAREPIAYILGLQEFWSLDFQVSEDVLIPRPETECLVETVLARLGAGASAKSLRIVDLGTGSGAIAIALATELPAARLVATDISPAALAIAQRNALTHRVAQRIELRSGDLFDALSDHNSERFDVVVSNPPYIEAAVIPTLAPDVRDWEPRCALDGGADGLDFYRRIAEQAAEFLAPGGLLVLEIGAGMGRLASALFANRGCYRDVAVHQDYAGRDRVVIATGALCS
jgi:release factor glutamine methyltransferase